MTQQVANSPRTMSRSMGVRRRSMQKDHIVGSYKIGRKIGNGAYGAVYQAFKLSTGEKLAVKIIPFDESNAASAKYEAKLCKQISHENIVGIEEVIQISNKIFIFMEYCQKGELFEYVKNHGPLSQEMTGKIFTQLYSAIKYLHLKKIAHRDIKAQNVLLDAQMNPKLIDFGLAKEYNAYNPMMQTFCGSPSYVAPEIIKKQKYIGEKVDVWSLGVTLYVMLEAAQPFYAKSNTETKTKILNHKWSTPKHSSREAIELYEQIFVAPSNRINLLNIQNSSFFQKHAGKKMRLESKSTQKTERLSTGQGSELVLPQVMNTQRKKQSRSSIRVYLELESMTAKKHEPIYNSVLCQSKQKLDQKRRSIDLKSLKGDFRVKITPTKNPKKFGQVQDFGLKEKFFQI